MLDIFEYVLLIVFGFAFLMVGFYFMATMLSSMISRKEERQPNVGRDEQHWTNQE